MKKYTWKYSLLFLIAIPSMWSNHLITSASNEYNPASAGTDLFFRISLYAANQNPGDQGVNSFDGLLLQFGEDSSNCKDNLDADKFFGPDEGIFTVVDGNEISIEFRKTPTTNFNDVIDLHFLNLTDPSYKLYFEFLDTTGLNKFTNGILLWDKCENTYTSISDLDVVPFDLTCTNSNAYFGERFALVFKQNPLVNDNSFNAIELNLDENSAGDAFTTAGATSETNEPSINLNGGINGSVWFSFIAPASGKVKITTDILGGTTDDTEIAVYSNDGSCSADFSEFNQIAYDDDSGESVPNSSSLNLENLTQGERYFIQVDGTSTSTEGSFGIEVRDVIQFTYNTSEGYLPFSPNGQGLSESILVIEEGTAVLDQPTELESVTVRPNAVLSLSSSLDADVSFESNASGTAQLGNATGATINGTVTVEQYIPAGLPNLRRAYRLLSSSVNSTGSINANWQEGAVTTAAGNGNPNPGFGTHITGGTAANGFDQSGSGNPSMFTFDNTAVSNQDLAWEVLPNTNVKPLKAGEAYLTFIRGDRSVSLTDNSTTPTNTTLRATGDLHTGPRVFSSANNASAPEYGLSTVANNFNLVGNPYQAIVDINNLALANIKSNTYWVWDPNLGSRGNYSTVSLPSGIASAGSANQFIQPGQSFFVQTVADGAASLSFNEDDKNVTGGATAVFSEQSEPTIKLLLYTTAAYNAGERESDGTLIIFSENGNNDLDLFDADKLQGPDEGLARLHHHELISIEQRNMPTETESLPLSISGYTKDHYTFVANATHIDTRFEAFLQDSYTQTLTPLHEGSTPIHFSVDSGIPESIAEDRFSLVFDNTTLSTQENAFGAGFSLYPNPTHNGLFSIKTPGLSGEVNVQMTNMLGQNVYYDHLNVEGQQVRVLAQELSAGVYIVRLTQDEQTYSTKLIVE